MASNARIIRARRLRLTAILDQLDNLLEAAEKQLTLRGVIATVVQGW